MKIALTRCTRGFDTFANTLVGIYSQILANIPYYIISKFRKKIRMGLFFCVNLTWNDPIRVLMYTKLYDLALFCCSALLREAPKKKVGQMAVDPSSEGCNK